MQVSSIADYRMAVKHDGTITPVSYTHLRHSQCPERTRWYPCKDYERKETSTTGTAYNLPGRGGDSAEIKSIQIHRN